MWGMAARVMQEEGGVRALYRGVVPTAVGVAPYVVRVIIPYVTCFFESPSSSSLHRASISLLMSGFVGFLHHLVETILHGGNWLVGRLLVRATHGAQSSIPKNLVFQVRYPKPSPSPLTLFDVRHPFSFS